MATLQESKRDVAVLEARRFEAARMFARGQAQAAVVHALGVSRQTAHRWYHTWRRQGRAGLKAVGRLGRKPRLDRRQLARVDTALRRGARAHGFSTDLWTLPRVATVIERLTGVRYHPGHVWYILRGLNWSVQRPARRARERDAAAIRRWVARRWPQVKKRSPAARVARLRGRERPLPAAGRPTHHLGPARGAACPDPPRRHLEASLGGRRPAFRWDGRRTRVYFHTRPGPYIDTALLAFLRALTCHFRSERVILLWGGLGAHRSRRRRGYLAQQRPWLTTERLPADAPELNPVELLFGNVKGGELANHCGPDLATLAGSLRTGLARVRRQPRLA